MESGKINKMKKLPVRKELFKPDEDYMANRTWEAIIAFKVYYIKVYIGIVISNHGPYTVTNKTKP